MTICFFTAKYFDGSGDIVQTVKIADFVKKLAESKGYLDDVIIVVPDTQSPDHKAITQRFLDDINPKVHVQTISEFKKGSPDITCCIQAAYSGFDWKEELRELITEDVPIIYMPEYDNDLSPDGATKILGGFNAEKGDVGVIPSQDLLEATTEETIPHEKIQHAFEQLHPKIKKYLHHDFESYISSRDSHELSFQYSHDVNTYPTYYGENYGKTYTPIQFFLQEHIMLASHSIRSQDVFCLGDEAETKKGALLELKDTLIQNGYTKIVFINIDEETEEILHQSSTSAKEYRVLYSKSVPFSTMQVLPLLANDFVGATGDNSLVEAMSARKLVSYECFSHKTKLVEGYLSAVSKETNNEKVLLLAKFLMKKTVRCNNVEYNESEIGKLLKNKQVVEELKNINRNLVAKSQYFRHVEKILVSDVFKRIFMAKQFLSEIQANQLAELSKILLDTVRNNKIDSPVWSNRFEAATKIYKLTHDKEEHELANVHLNQLNVAYIKKQLEIIEQNKPSWNERPLLSKILDVLSLGLAPLIRHLFFYDSSVDCVARLNIPIQEHIENTESEYQLSSVN